MTDTSDVNPLLGIVLQAYPQIQQLQALQQNAQTYQDQITTYTEKLTEVQAEISTVMASLKDLSTQFVTEYNTENPPAATDPAPTSTDTPTDPATQGGGA